MSSGTLKVKGTFAKVFEADKEDGSVRVLFKNEVTRKELNDSIIMVRFTKSQWRRIKKKPNLMDVEVTLDGQFQVSITKDNKPYIYMLCTNIIKVKADKESEETTENDEVKDEKLASDIEEQDKIKKIKAVKWYTQIPEDEFVDIDISKVKLVEELHLNSIVKGFDIRKMRNYTMTPIAVRKAGDEYELVTGVAMYIVAKLLSRDVKAYITDLDIATFREKYSIY